MQTINFDRLYNDFKKFFDLCRYTDDALKTEILNRIKDENRKDLFLFKFRSVIFKFEISENNVEYIGYEK